MFHITSPYSNNLLREINDLVTLDDFKRISARTALQYLFCWLKTLEEQNQNLIFCPPKLKGTLMAYGSIHSGASNLYHPI